MVTRFIDSDCYDTLISQYEDIEQKHDAVVEQHDPAQKDRAFHQEREGPTGTHHRVRREPVGYAGRQHDGVCQGPDRLPADLRDGDQCIETEWDLSFYARAPLKLIGVRLCLHILDFFGVN